MKINQVTNECPKTVTIQAETRHQKTLEKIAGQFSTNNFSTSHPVAWSEEKIEFFSSISFLTRNMQIFGLYFVVNDNEKQKEGNRGRFRWWGAGRLYSTIVLAVLWLNLARQLSCFTSQETWEPTLLFRISGNLFLLATNLMVTCHYVAYSNGQLNRLLSELARYNGDEESDLEPVAGAACDKPQMIEVYSLETSDKEGSGCGNTEFKEVGVPSFKSYDGSTRERQRQTVSPEVQL